MAMTAMDRYDDDDDDEDEDRVMMMAMMMTTTTMKLIDYTKSFDDNMI